MSQKNFMGQKIFEAKKFLMPQKFLLGHKNFCCPEKILMGHKIFWAQKILGFLKFAPKFWGQGPKFRRFCGQKPTK